MKAQDAIVLLKDMQNPLQDYADMVGAAAFGRYIDHGKENLGTGTAM